MTTAPSTTSSPPFAGDDAPDLQIAPQQVILGLVLLFEVAVFGLLGENFLTLGNLLTVLRQNAELGLLALALTPVILTGGIDLSVGSIVGLAGIVAGVLLEGLTVGFLDVTMFPPVWAVILVVLAVGAAVCWVNGTLVTRFVVAAFI